ncbi:glyoxalase domain-containing protein 4-like [Bolinopsis microptera]|uniref:glyoxalase domain-containing protein 4-like n=1 Tax=Bolinopsis microptera TaxID=2820187 RepID=UPI003078E3D1
MTTRRALHWVFKIGDRAQSVNFLRHLGMKVLRHEEFKEGCDASCNGPYQGRWSKTMIGYGVEDTNFVLELTYNYGIDKYELGNDFLGLHIESSDVFAAAKEEVTGNGSKMLESPDGYLFHLENKNASSGGPVAGITLASTNIQATVSFWSEILGLTVFDQSETSATLGIDQSQAYVKFVHQAEINHAKAYGRVAFSVPISVLADAEKLAIEKGFTILTPFVTLKTDGKADVSVVIFSDPDGYEICFVGDEGFRDLSQFDPEGSNLLDKAIDEDKSNEWFAKKGKSKSSA